MEAGVCGLMTDDKGNSTCRADEAINDCSETTRQPKQQEEHYIPSPGVAELKYKVNVS